MKINFTKIIDTIDRWMHRDYYSLTEASNEELEFLIKNGVNINAKDRVGETALMFASKYGYLEKVKLLIESGADINAKNKYGSTSLIWASSEGHLEIVKYLVEEMGMNINDKDNDGETSLMRASYKGYLETVEYEDVIELFLKETYPNDGISKESPYVKKN